MQNVNFKLYMDVMSSTMQWMSD